ncbi:unnamed protein product, partial [Vitis vinifera]
MDYSWGRAIYGEQLYLWDPNSRNLTDLTTNFSFVIDSLNSSSYADGLTFFLNDTQLPSRVWGENIGLTEFNVTNTTAIHFVVVDNIKEGKLNHVSICYTSSSQNLSVVLITEFMGDRTTSQSLYYKVDLREYLPEFVNIGFSGATGRAFQKNNIHSWNFSSTLQPPSPVEPGDGKNGKKTGFVVGLSVYDTDSDPTMDEDFEKGIGLGKFSFQELALATSNFAEEEKLGEGGFGGVYRGFLRKLNSYVVIKREYAFEVKIISPLRHQNLVQLMGWCHNKRELVLVCELIPNGNLSSCLLEEKTLLTWAMRYKIALGLASSLLYLHEEWEQCVAHRDIKSSNVMLDSDFNAKLGDFGLARLVDHGKGSQTTVLAGTWDTWLLNVS